MTETRKAAFSGRLTDDPYHTLALDIIENTDYRECLRRKSRCHIVFDHMQGYYGVSSLESLSQGKPVICGLDNWNIRCIRKFAGTSRLPWVIARNKGELEKALITLIMDKSLRNRMGREARQFMENNWSEQQVLDILLPVYNSL